MTNVGYFPLIKVDSDRDLQNYAEQRFSDIMWSESMIFETFEEAENLTFSAGKYFRIRPGQGMEVLLARYAADDPGGIVTTPLILETTNDYEDLSPTPRQINSPQAFPANDVTEVPTISGTYEGDYPKDYKVMISETGGGSYSEATYEVYEMPNITTPVLSGLSVDSWEYILNSGTTEIQIKWESDPGDNYGPGDAWLIGMRTGNIRSFLVDFETNNDSNTSVKLDLSLNGGSTYIEDILPNQQYTEEDYGYGWFSEDSGNDLDWKITISGSLDSEYCLLEHLFIFTGDYDAITYWML